MATEIKLRRGTTSQHASFNGAEGEVTFDTDKHTLIVHNNEGNGTGRQIALLSDVQAEDTLAEMNDVNLTSPTNGSFLQYDNASSKWIDTQTIVQHTDGIKIEGTSAGSSLFGSNDFGLAIDNNSGVGAIQVSGSTLAYIDLQTPEGDNASDFDVRLISGDSSNGTYPNAQLIAKNQNLDIKTTGSGDVNLQRQGSVKLSTSANGIDVTGEVKGDTLDIDGNASIAGAVTDVTNLTASATIAAQTLNINTVNAVGVLSSGIVRGGSLDINGDADISGDLVLGGDLNVTGTTTTVNQTNLDVSDNIIGLNRGASTNSNDSGFIIERGSTGDNAIFAWDESADKFTLGTTTATPSSTGDLTIATGTLVANVEGNLTGDVTGNVSGTAATVTQAAQTAITSVGDLTALNVNGTVTADGLTVDGSTAFNTGATSNGVLIDGTGGGTGLQIRTSETATLASPDLTFTRTGNRIVGGATNIGQIHFDAKNSNSGNSTFAEILGRATDYTEGAEDGSFLFRPKSAGTLVNALEVNKNGIDVTGTVTADSFIIEDGSGNKTTLAENAGSDITLTLPSATGTLALTSDVAGTTLTQAAQTNITSLGTLTGLTTGATTVNGALTVNDNSLEIVSTDAGATVNPILSLYRNSASPAASDDLGAIQFYGEDDGGNKTLYAQIHGFAQDETGGTEDGEIHFSCMAGASFEDPVMKLTKSAVQLQANNDLILSQNSNIRFEGTTTSGSHRTTLFVENPTATNTVNLPDGTGVLEVGALASGAVEDGTSIAQDTFSTYKGQKIVFTGSSDCTIGLPDAAAGDIGSTWTVCNAGSANVIFDLDAVAAQTLKVLTGAAVTSVGTVNPHIVAGGVASLVCTAADNYILFGSGVVINT